MFQFKCHLHTIAEQLEHQVLHKLGGVVPNSIDYETVSKCSILVKAYFLSKFFFAGRKKEAKHSSVWNVF